MDDYILRPYAPGDRDGCAALWEQVFGDPAELVTQFLSLFEAQEGFCLLAEHSGEIAAAAYSLPGLTVLRPGRPDLPARYLYAVATHPVHRKNGLAAALCRGLRDDAFVQGALLLTKPAEPSLYPWYAEKNRRGPGHALPSCDRNNALRRRCNAPHTEAVQHRAGSAAVRRSPCAPAGRAVRLGAPAP